MPAWELIGSDVDPIGVVAEQGKSKQDPRETNVITRAELAGRRRRRAGHPMAG
jgi:hypothetical protein